MVKQGLHPQLQQYSKYPPFIMTGYGCFGEMVARHWPFEQKSFTFEPLSCFSNTHIDQWTGNVTENGRCSKPQSRPALINTSLRRSSSTSICSWSANVHPAGLWLVGGLARRWIQLGFKTKQTFFTTLRIVFISTWFVDSKGRIRKQVEVGILEQN